MPNEISTLLKKVGLFLVAVAIFFWIYQDPKRDESGAIVESGNIDPFDLYVGDCYAENFAPADDEPFDVSNVEAVPCSDPHNNEIIAKFDKLENPTAIQEDWFDQAYEQCWLDASYYLEYSETTPDSELERFNNLYSMNVLYYKYKDTDGLDPNKNFVCVLVNRDVMTNNSTRNFFISN